ncbi:amidohydrolase [Actinomadura bangladeshensis]|uniref:Amidohydrolase n=1 Tax=Actinomadura bangladeshensis TaxID=453573 RepID=A0A4R4N7Q5_9ACTN|nr:amidohydrolase [Actinomadura bangladeshensis]TDC04909.1 amidohydrolase [Actinomadura bangladeshensis]
MRNHADDHIVRAGSVITMDAARPRAEALAVRGGRIAAAGSFDEARAALGEHAPVLDLGDATVLPGLIDTHMHLLWTGLAHVLLDLAGERSIEGIVRATRAWADAHPEAPWVVSSDGWEIEDVAERRLPTREELDRACPDRPVLILRCGHEGAANSAALAIAGLTDGTPDPPGGRLGRDAAGRLTGVLIEPPAIELVRRYMPPQDDRTRRIGIAAAAEQALAAGLTSVIEPGLRTEELATYQGMREDGELPLRVTAMPLLVAGASVEDEIARLSGIGVRSGFGDDRLRLGPVKVFLDGGGSLGTAYLREPWPGRCGDHGQLLLDPDSMRTLAAGLVEHGWSLGVHAVGGGALDLLFDVLDHANRVAPVEPLRCQAIHAYLTPSEQNMADARRLGVVVATQPTMQEQFADRLISQLDRETAAAATPLATWHRAGVRLAGGSDSPVTPFQPLRGIWQAVTRHHAPSGGPLGPDERLDVDAALRMYTSDAAYAAFNDHAVGVLRPGMRADWVALGADPTQCPQDDLRDLPVLATAVDGVLRHRT